MPLFMSYLLFDQYCGKECDITAFEAVSYVVGNFKLA